MRKMVELLDEEQREAMFNLVDCGIAIFGAALIVCILQGFVELAVG